MVSEEDTRKMVRELSQAGWMRTRTVGSHSSWQCPTRQHKVSVPDGHRKQTPGLVRKIRAAIAGCDCKEETR